VLLQFEPFSHFANRGGMEGRERQSAASATEGEEHGEWRTVAFTARKLSGGEPRYSTTEKEAGAFVFALRKWRHLLDGKTFEAVTDHLAL
jgi:RNase H-like domain found in reverse transcriptase